MTQRQMISWGWLAVLSFAVGLASSAAAQESTPEAIAAYSDSATLHNAKEFQLASEKWDDFLKKYAKDPLAPQAQHYLGVCQLELKQYDKAAATFAAVIKNYPTAKLTEQSYLSLGLTQYTLGAMGTAGMYDQAVATFANQYKLFPKGESADQCLYQWGESLYALNKLADAANAYDLLVRDFPQSKFRADALYALGVAREDLAQFPQAGAAYDAFLKEFDKNLLVTEVKMRKARTVMEAGDFKTAEKLFGEVAAVPGFKDADFALLKQGLCIAKQDRFAEAAAVYAAIEKVNPQSTSLPEATLAAARSFYRADKLDEAAAWFAKSLTKNDKNSPEAAHWQCRILLRNKKPAEAAALAAQWLPAAVAAQSPYLVNLKVDQADALFDIPEKQAESRELYAKVAAEHPQSELAAQSLYNAAFAALETKQFDKGIEHATKFVQIFPQDKLLPDTKFVNAECLLQLKKYPEAEAAYKEMLAAFPQNPELETWLVRQGLCQFLQKKYAEVAANLGKAVSTMKKPDLMAEAEYYVGAGLFFTDKYAEATPWFDAALKANPKWRQADETLLLLSRTQRKLDKTADAKATVTRLIAEFPTSAVLDQANYRLGEYCFAANEFPAAIAAYDQVIMKFPQSAFSPYAWYGRGWAELKAKAFPNAAASFGEVLTRFKDHTLTADAHFGRAMARRQAGEFQGAVEDVDAYLKTMPDVNQRPDALYEKALAQVSLKDNAGAAATLSLILKESPKYAGTDKVLYELAWALKSQDKSVEAIPHFQRLATEFAESPLAPEAWFHVGEDHYQKKNYVEAAKAYTAAKAKVAKGELGEQVIYKLGFSHYLQKNYDEAVKEFTQQLTDYNMGRLHPDGFFMRAESLYKKENYKDAFPAFKDAAKTKPSSPTIEMLTYLHGGQSAAQVKQWPDSVSLLSSLLTKFPDSPYLAEANYELGYALQNSGKPDEALKSYEVAATKSRDQIGARARFMMGEVYFEKKLYAEAAKEFKLVMYGYGGDQATAETKNWQAKAGYELGRCAEVQISSAKDAPAKAVLVGDAKKGYGFVVEKHSAHELAAQAKKQLETLSKL